MSAHGGSSRPTPAARGESGCHFTDFSAAAVLQGGHLVTVFPRRIISHRLFFQDPLFHIRLERLRTTLLYLVHFFLFYFLPSFFLLFFPYLISFFSPSAVSHQHRCGDPFLPPKALHRSISSMRTCHSSFSYNPNKSLK